jgi:hypothetical protein
MGIERISSCRRTLLQPKLGAILHSVGRRGIRDMVLERPSAPGPV